MKYIKLFEEKWEQPGEELLDFSIDNLVYLMDDGFKIKIEDETSDQYDAIRIRKGERPFDGPFDKLGFNWEEVKDIFLPFFIRLDRKYEVMVITFFTKNLGSSVSFTKDGYAKIQELLDEEKSYNNIRGWDFEEIRIKVKKLPLIYNKNESFDRWSRDQKNELTEYCETNLAYLMDEGFRIRVGQQYAIGNVSIGIKKESLTLKQRAERCVEREDFNWGDIKDHFIPFCVRLEKEYEISEIKILGPSINLVIRDNFENQLDKLSTEVVSYIDIYLSGEKEQLNESLSPKEELEDFCDTHLAYLTDKNFEVEYTEQYGGHMTEVVIKISGVTQIFTWDEVKDHFIPFLHMLSKQYNLFNFHFEDFDCKKSEFVCFQTFMGSKYYYSCEDVISDNIDTEQFTKRYGLYSIKLKIGKKIT